MKRPKRAKLQKKEEVHTICSIVCPHCNTELVGFAIYCKRILCWACDNEIIVE